MRKSHKPKLKDKPLVLNVYLNGSIVDRFWTITEFAKEYSISLVWAHKCIVNNTDVKGLIVRWELSDVRLCRGCGEWLDIKEFYNPIYGRCKQCHRKSYHKNKGKK